MMLGSRRVLRCSLGATALSAMALGAMAGCTSEGPRAAQAIGDRDSSGPAPGPRKAGDSPPLTKAASPSSAAGSSASRSSGAASPGSASAAAEAPPPSLDRARYPWLADSSVKPPAAVEPLVARFAPPLGYRRVPVASGSFGAWLRGLPLAAPGTPVVSFEGGVILPDGHENLAAVIAVDIGTADLQQCADSVIRMHAEWQWAAGARDMSYRAASGSQMPYARWTRGERPVATANGQSLNWEPRARPDPDGGAHPSFRKYLDNVFMWANTGALAVQAKKIAAADIRPGDFVVLPGNPGHAVLVLDMATSEGGDRAALLGQGFMPAQSFQVLRPSPASAWFRLDLAGPGIKTPFWPTFPWDALRRLDAT